MQRRHDDLFNSIASFQALRAAAKRALKGKRRKPGASSFQAGLERELLRLERTLQAATYRPGRYLEIHVRDPKPRMVSAAPFRDRVVHHAVHEVVAPIFEGSAPTRGVRAVMIRAALPGIRRPQWPCA